MKLLHCLAIALLPAAVVAEPPPAGTVQGNFTLDGQPVTLRHAYVVRREKGFFEADDPAWTIILSANPLSRDMLAHPFIDPSLRLGITLTREFDAEPTLQVGLHELLVGSFQLSGGASPLLDLRQTGDGGFSGRIHLSEEQTFFDNTYHYDLNIHAVPARE